MAFKPISEYPRPPLDNGRGVHWSAIVYHPAADNLQYWMDELKAMQIKWVKVLDDGGKTSLKLCQALLDNDIMPIVRIYREHPNPGRINGGAIDAIKHLVDVGVHYFETNNEPDLPAEWKNNRRPDNWLDIVVDNFIYDADFIQKVGGLPGFPAMGSGAQRNGIAKVVERGRIDIFEKGAWLAIHNYTLNHPLDYPYDAVNQEGRALTREEYDRLAAWQYGHLSWDEIQTLGIDISRENYDRFNRWAWDGRSLEQVNAERAAHKNPGATIFDDANCFGSWQAFGKSAYEALGFYIPVISTEGGPVVGWGDDLRYAKMSPATQAEYQIKITQFMQDEAPPWYFTLCTWLLAAQQLGDMNPTWEQMAWYTNAWDIQFGLNGQLPVVQKMKDTPANIRHELRSGITAGTIKGGVYGSHEKPLPGVTLSLRTQEGKTIAVTTSNEQGAYQFTVVPGVYDLIIPWLGVVVQDATIVLDDIDTFDITNVDPPGDYSITGRLIGPAQSPVPGQIVSIQRRSMVHARTKTDAQGRFSFHPKLAGSYVIATDTAATQIDLTPDEPQITLTLLSGDTAKKRYVVTKKRLLSAKETGHNELIFGVVSDSNGNGINGVELEMQWADAAPTTKFPRTTTGKVVSKPDGYYQFMHSKGSFLVKIIDGNHESDIADGLNTANIPGRENTPISYEVDFQLLPVIQSAQESVIAGSIPGGRSGQLVRLWKDGQVVDKTDLNSVKKFRFTALGIGAYDLELAGIGIIETDILLDGHRKETIQFPLMGAIVGAVINDHKHYLTIKLISETYGFIRHSDVSRKGNYRFTHLPAGAYRIELNDKVIPDLKSDGQSVLEAPPLHIIASEKENSRIEGVVHNADHLPVLVLPVQLKQQGHYLATTKTAVDGRFVFDSLAPGTYEIAIGDHVYHENIVLDGENVVEIQITYPDVSVSTASEQHLDRYYLLRMAKPRLTPTTIQFIAAHLPIPPKGPVGFDIAEAQRAYEVVLIGDGIPDSVVLLLKDAHCKIQDMRGDLLFLSRKLKNI